MHMDLIPQELEKQIVIRTFCKEVLNSKNAHFCTFHDNPFQKLGIEEFRFVSEERRV